jgi:AAHS family 4-hydroxybenzoate transporter-like MFS transporter
MPARHRAFAVTATIVCVPLGATLAGLLAIPMLPALGWRGLFAIGGVTSLAVAAALIRWLPESPRFLARHPARRDRLIDVLRRLGHDVPAGAEFTDPGERHVGRASFGALFVRESAVDTIALWSAFFFCLLAVYSGFNWIPSMLTGAGLDATVANAGITAYNLGGVIGALGGGLAIRHFGSRPTMMGMAAAAAAVAMGLSAMTLSPGMPAAPIVAVLGLAGALINAVQVTMYALAANVYSTAIRATGVGTATSVGRLGAILSTYAGASALELGGHTSFFVLVAAAMAAVCVSLAFVRHHIPRVPGVI